MDAEDLTKALHIAMRFLKVMLECAQLASDVPSPSLLTGHSIAAAGLGQRNKLPEKRPVTVL